MQPNQFKITAAREKNTSDIIGIVAAGAARETTSFFGTDELMQVLEAHMNENNLPMSATADRTLGKSGGVRLGKDKRDAAQAVETQDKSTFVVTVLYRQNATWQGTVKWVEGEKESKFRSALELIKLMDGAIGTDEQSK